MAASNDESNERSNVRFPTRLARSLAREAICCGLAGAAGRSSLAGRAGLAAARQAGQGQVGDPDLAGRRAAAPGFVRSQAGRGQRLLRTAEQPDCDQRGRDPHRRAAPFAGEAGRQVLAHPQHDPRRQRPRDGGLSDADRPAAGRPAGLPVRRGRGLAVQGLRGRLQGADSALRRAHPVAGAILRSRLSGTAPHAVRHGGRPGAAEVHGGRGRFPRPQRPAAREAARAASQAQHPGQRRQRQSRP